MTSLTLLLGFWPGAPVRAEPSKEKEVSADGLRKQLQWEDKVVGPKQGKQIDHAKIAALQEQARRDEANRPKTPQKTARPEGVSGPASSTLPTMDIEKPAPAGSVHYPAKKTARAEAPKSHDAIDDFLAMNTTNEQSTKTNVATRATRGAKSSHRKHARRASAR
ncbi:MAG TPA: hypothetical protein VMU50_05560 [Polyangia bacterium]|nr:hypothetical protein [Polyangia bacterium]